MTELSLWHAFVLGIIEGVTEYIPVSSTGHLIFASALLGIEGDKVETFDIVIQAGAILAVLFLYWYRFVGLFDFSVAGSQGFKGWPGLLKVIVACVPAGIVGVLFGEPIKRQLFSPLPVSLALIAGAVCMLVFDRPSRTVRTQDVESISLLQSLGIGLFQCLALWPGMSRSASTIVGGLILGFDRRVAAEFSFLVAVPIMLAATGYDFLRSLGQLSWGDAPAFLVGLVVSFVSAWLAVKFFVALLGRWTLRPFAVYRIVIGLLVLVWLV